MSRQIVAGFRRSPCAAITVLSVWMVGLAIASTPSDRVGEDGSHRESQFGVTRGTVSVADEQPPFGRGQLHRMVSTY